MATVVVTHPDVLSTPANPTVGIDSTKWNHAHTVTGLENVQNVDTTNASNITSGTLASARLSSGKPIFILSTGQSQLTTRPTLAWTPNASAKVWNFSGVDGNVGTAFAALQSATVNLAEKVASDIADANPLRPVFLLNVAFTGQAIAQWMAGAAAPDVYQNILNNITAALAAAGVTKIDLFLWAQGEANTLPLNVNQVANHATVMTRFWTNSWFPQETPTQIYGICATAISGNADGDNMNDVLSAIASADPAKRRYIDLAAFPASYWDGTNPGHMLGIGYFAAGALGANAYAGRAGRQTLKNIVVDRSTGNVVIGPNSVSASAPLAVSQHTAPVLASVSGSVVAYFLGAAGAGVYPMVDAIGNFSNYVGRRANGTYAVKTTLAANDLITGLGAQGFDSSAYSGSNDASFSMFASETWTAAHHGTYGSVYNTLPGTLTIAENVRFSPGSIKLFATTGSDVTIDGLAWTAFSPSVTSGGGGFTNANGGTGSGTGTLTSSTVRYKQIGKTVYEQVTIAIATAGNATGQLIVTLPVTANSSIRQAAGGVESSVGNPCYAQILTSDATHMYIAESGGATTIANGNVITIGITYEAA